MLEGKLSPVARKMAVLMSIAENLSRDPRANRSARQRGRAGSRRRRADGGTKTHPAERSIIEASHGRAAAVRRNRVQEFAERLEALAGELRDADFHMIGHLQSNKSGKAVEDLFVRSSSVDSRQKLAKRLNTAAEKFDKSWVC